MMPHATASTQLLDYPKLSISSVTGACRELPELPSALSKVYNTHSGTATNHCAPLNNVPGSHQLAVHQVHVHSYAGCHLRCTAVRTLHFGPARWHIRRGHARTLGHTMSSCVSCNESRCLPTRPWSTKSSKLARSTKYLESCAVFEHAGVCSP